MFNRTLAALIVAGLAGPSIACGVDGDDPAAWGMVQYVQRDGVFALAFLSPPWEPLQTEPALRLRIDPEVFGFNVDIAASTHGLDIAPVTAMDRIAGLQGVEGFVPDGERFDPLAGLDLPGGLPSGLPSDLPGAEERPPPLLDVALDDPFAVAQAELTSLAIDHGARIDFDLAPLTNDGGQNGVSFQVVTTHETFMRVVYLPSAAGVVRAAMVSVFDLATADVDQMLAGLVTDVAPSAANNVGSDG